MGRFKNFLLEQVLFNYSISYVNAEGESKVATVKASLQNDAMNKFKAMDSSKGYKEILAVRKGDVVTPSQERKDMKESVDMEDLRHDEIKNLGLDKMKPEFKMKYHGQYIPLKSKTKVKAREEAVKYANDHGFKPHHADLIAVRKVNSFGRIIDVEEKFPLPFTP